MTRESHRRLWPIVAVVVLLFIYPLSVGPFAYMVERGWISGELRSEVYSPLWLVVGLLPSFGIEDYYWWWYELGRKHAAP